jgi:hypothetical protein
VHRNTGSPVRGSGEPRWKRYGIHWHLFARREGLADRSRSAGFVDDHYRAADPDEVLRDPDEVVEWLRRHVAQALREARGRWADPRAQGFDDLGDSGEWARSLRAVLEKGMSSFQRVRVSDTHVADVTAFAISGKDCERHRDGRAR